MSSPTVESTQFSSGETPWASAIQSIVVSGLVKDNQGNPSKLQVLRGDPEKAPRPDRWPTAAYQVPPHRAMSKSAAIDTRPASPSGPGVGESLEVMIGKMLYDGEHAWIFEVTVLTESSSRDRVDSIPPVLVAKIAKRSTGHWLSREAGAYDALQSLQGVVLARCYGYFQCDVNLAELSVVPWDPHCVFPRTEETIESHAVPHPRASLNILLLERLGKPLSTFRRSELGAMPEPRGNNLLRKELVDMFMAAADFGIAHNDVRSPNILEAHFPGPTSDAASLVSTNRPGSGRWRLIDWERYATPPGKREQLELTFTGEVITMIKYELCPEVESVVGREQREQDSGSSDAEEEDYDSEDGTGDEVDDEQEESMESDGETENDD